MAIWRRPDRDGWPYLDLSYTDENGQSRRKKVKCPSRDPKAIKRFERDVRARIAAGTYGTKDSTLREFAPALVAHLRAAKRKPSYIHEAKRILTKHIVPTLGSKALRSIKPSDIDKYKTTKSDDGLSDKTINNHLGVLSKLLRLAADDGLIPAAPRVKLISVPVVEAAFFSEEEATALVGSCSGRLRTMVVVALGTGVRLGELIALRWSDIDLDAATLTVRRQWCDVSRTYTTPKNSEFRVLPLPGHVITELRAWPKTLRSPLLFPTRGRNRKPGVVDKSDAGKSLRRACKRAGIDSCGWHKCRHTYASWLVQRGVDLYRVQRLLGHKTIQQTQRYAHLAPSSLRDAVEVLG